ncbi:hypothetical protein JW758_05395 [Candidatus Peregrinibacteria bacterium]|nr:hypothetical protein [Candidatus Peregrinibacteria bacterium]
MFHKIIKSLTVIGLFLTLAIPSTYALNKSQAKDAYIDAHPGGYEYYPDQIDDQIDSVISSMEASQAEVVDTVDGLEERIRNINSNDPKKDPLTSQMKKAKDAADDFSDIEPKNHLIVVDGPEGVLPQILPDNAFQDAQDKAISELNMTNRMIINPPKPGAVPEGDIIEDFLPQLIRQLFRFAWLAILVAFVVSGFMFITSFDNDEKITKAKHMIYYTLVGFAAVTLAFAIVKAVTDIDFFRFI